MVRLPIYRSEFAALKMNIKMQALRTAGRPWIPATLIAATNGEAAAELLFLTAKASSGELYGMIIPRKKMLRQ